MTLEPGLQVAFGHRLTEAPIRFTPPGAFSSTKTAMISPVLSLGPVEVPSFKNAPMA